ncbi:MAG: hypothetical protein QMD09_13485, partial [Desulfatibacillaceae bacterium]|nr:hypothetical protein [Desulfatibacillaceae bacterium]
MRGFFPYAGFAAAILLWAGATSFLDISEAILPGPWPVFLTGVELVADGSLIRHAVASLFRVTVGFYLAVLAGIPLGILMGWWFPANAIINPMLQFLRPISPL